MSLYIIGIIAAFTATTSHAWCNIFDGYLSSKVFKNLTNLIFFSVLLNLFFIPIVLFFDFPKLLTYRLYGIILVISLMDLLYTYPYYWALRRIDTSVVASLFEIGKIFVPLFAYLILGEQLATAQYIGFFLIVISSVLLTFDPKKLRLDKSLLFMFIVSVILTTQSILYKYLFTQGVSWGSAVFWKTALDLVVIVIPVLLPSSRRAFKESFKKIKEVKWLFLLNQFLGWGGESANTLALLFIPVSVEKGITSTQSIFVLLFAVLFAKKSKKIFHEKIERRNIWKKGLLLAFIIIGAMLVTGL